jgi:hypothetical protein
MRTHFKQFQIWWTFFLSGLHDDIVIVEDQSSVHFDHGIERKEQGSSFLAYFNVVCVGKIVL